MGWSCTKSQSEALERVDAAVDAQPGYINDSHSDGLPPDGCVFVEHPTGGPYGKDYGYPGAEWMCLPVMQMCNGGQNCHRIGYIRIGSNGEMRMPRRVRQILKLS